MLNEIQDYLNLSKNVDFARFLGVKPNVLTNWHKRNTFDAELIHETCTSINPSWLLTGKGEMLLGESPNIPTGIKSTQGMIPLVNIEAIGGFGSTDFAIKEQDIKAQYEVPDFYNVDFMIRVKGVSMYPKYNSGDVVACRRIVNSKFLQWGKVYVIATREQGILIKRLNLSPSKETILAVSDNPDYKPFEIPNNEITGIALVIGVIRLE